MNLRCDDDGIATLRQGPDRRQIALPPDEHALLQLLVGDKGPTLPLGDRGSPEITVIDQVTETKKEPLGLHSRTLPRQHAATDGTDLLGFSRGQVSTRHRRRSQ